MTIYTHAFVGLALATLIAHRRMPWPYWLLAGLLPIVPDLDSFSGAAYGAPLGHRGVTHSLFFALWLSFLAATLTYRRCKANLWALTGCYFLITASHAVLDALTKGGFAMPFFWPLDGRYGNWGPVPVPDVGFEFPDPRTSRSLMAELLWVWAPMSALVGFVAIYRRSRILKNAVKVVPWARAK